MTSVRSYGVVKGSSSAEIGTSVSPWAWGGFQPCGEEMLHTVPATWLPCLTATQRTRQGLTLVHIFAQSEPILSLKPVKQLNTWDKQCSR